MRGGGPLKKAVGIPLPDDGGGRFIETSDVDAGR